MRFRVLDSWRGVCALWVAIYHFRIVSNVQTVDLFRTGTVAVEFFFVLSGFVIFTAYGDRLKDNRDRLRFLVRRIGRLYPLHLLTLLCVALMESARWLVSARIGHVVGGPLFSESTAPVAFGLNLALVHAWGMLPDFTWNVPSWSISVEFLMCLVFAATSFARRPAVVVIVMTGLGALAFLYQRYGLPQEEATTAVSRGLYAFFLGCGLRVGYDWWTARGRSVPGWSEWMVIPVLIIVPTFNFTLLPPLLFAAVIFVFAFQRGPLSRWVLDRPLFHYLGEISYSIYLVHYLVVLAVFGAAAAGGFMVDRGIPWIDIGPAWRGDVAIVVFLGLTIGLSALSYRFVEQPGRRFFNRLSDRIGKRKSSPAVA